MRSPNWSRDELILACALVAENGWRELRENDPAVRELSDLLRSLPLHEEARHAVPEFRSIGSVSHKTTDLATSHPSHAGARTRGGKLDKIVLAEFIARPDEMLATAAGIRAGISSGELSRIPEQEDEADEQGETASEGRLLARWALYRERSPKLRRKKLAEAFRLGQPLQCAVCDFNYETFYGDIGKGYIEVHHTLPLHQSGPRETSVNDLAFLCANCHRMCHRTYDGVKWRTPEALRSQISASAQRRLV